MNSWIVAIAIHAGYGFDFGLNVSPQTSDIFRIQPGALI